MITELFTDKTIQRQSICRNTVNSSHGKLVTSRSWKCTASNDNRCYRKLTEKLPYTYY